MALSDDFADAFVFRDLDIMRFEAGERTRVLSLLRQLEDEFIALLKDIDPTEPVQIAARRARIERLSGEIRRRSRVIYGRIARTFDTQLAGLSQIVGDDVAEMANQVAEIRLLRGRISEAQAEGLVSALLIEGASQSEWWDAQAEGLSRRFMQRVRAGTLTTEQNLTQIIRQIKGTAVARFRDGLRPVTDHQAETLVRTAMQQVVNDSRWRVYQQNSDVLRGVQASNPLDSGTTDICRARAGMAWTLDGEPFSGSVGRFPGPPPWHWGCRTILIPIVRTIGALNRLRGGRANAIQRRIQTLSREKRAAFNGQPAQGLTFTGWLNKRTASEQREILGPGKFDLWQKGQISMSDLIDQTGRPLTLGELRAKFAGSE